MLFGKGHQLQQLAAFTNSSRDYLQNRATGLNKQVTRKEPEPWPSWGCFAQLWQHKAVTKPAQTAAGGFPWRKRIPEWQRATKATPTQSHSLVPRNPWQLGQHNGARSTCYHSEQPKGCSIGQWMAKRAPSIFGRAQRPAFITSLPQPEVHRGNSFSRHCYGRVRNSRHSMHAHAFWRLYSWRLGAREEGSLDPARGRSLEAEPGFPAGRLSVWTHWKLQVKAFFQNFGDIYSESKYCGLAPYLVWCFR